MYRQRTPDERQRIGEARRRALAAAEAAIPAVAEARDESWEGRLTDHDRSDLDTADLCLRRVVRRLALAVRARQAAELRRQVVLPFATVTGRVRCA